MDNLQDKISQIMSDPEALSQIQSLGNMLGIGNTGNDAPVIHQKPESPPTPALADNMLSPDMMGKIAKLMPLFQQLRQEDDTTRLLTALRPFLSEEKCKKLDSAKRILQFMKLMPMLKESGLTDFGIF